MELDALPPGKAAPEGDRHLPFLSVQRSFFITHLALNAQTPFQNRQS
jgi:hypothetical protein